MSCRYGHLLLRWRKCQLLTEPEGGDEVVLHELGAVRTKKSFWSEFLRVGEVLGVVREGPDDVKDVRVLGNVIGANLKIRPVQTGSFRI